MKTFKEWVKLRENYDDSEHVFGGLGLDEPRVKKTKSGGWFSPSMEVDGDTIIVKKPSLKKMDHSSMDVYLGNIMGKLKKIGYQVTPTSDDKEYRLQFLSPEKAQRAYHQLENV